MVGFDYNRFPDLSSGESMACLADAIKCGICLNVLNDAIDTKCGHTFCKQCLHQWLTTSHTKECPECRLLLANRKRTRNEMIDSSEVIVGGNVLVAKSRRINQVIEKLRIKCDYEWCGCPHVCPLESLPAHLKSCSYSVCQSCDLNVGQTPDGHNCVNSLKKERNLWQQNCLYLSQKVTELETNANKWMKNFELKCKQTEQLRKELANKLQELGSTVDTTCEANADINSQDVSQQSGSDGSEDQTNDNQIWIDIYTELETDDGFDSDHSSNE